MFDSFYFAKDLLPKNKVDENHEFQTKSLGCDLDKYYIDSNRNVTRVPFFEQGEKDQELIRRYEIEEKINEVVYVRSHVFYYENENDLFGRKYLGSDVQEYKIVIKDNKLVYAEKILDEVMGEDNENP